MKAGRRWLLLAALVPAARAQDDVHARLRAAAERNDLPAFRAALAAGGDVNARDAQQDSAFLLAARNGHTEIVRMLVAAGSDVNQPGREGVTRLRHAERLGQAEVARMLRAAGAR